MIFHYITLSRFFSTPLKVRLGGKMGFAAQAVKTIKYNQNLLKKKRFFSKIGDSRAIRRPSKIDSYRLKRKSEILIKRHRKASLLRFLIIYPVIITFLVIILAKAFYLFLG